MNKKIGDMTESELKDFIIELQEENSRYERKNRKLKTDIKFFKAKINELEEQLSSNTLQLEEHKTQQQEFIKCLEDEIKTLEKYILETVDDMEIYMKQVKSLIIEEILQKYKEIIGGNKDE